MSLIERIRNSLLYVPESIYSLDLRRPTNSAKQETPLDLIDRLMDEFEAKGDLRMSSPDQKTEWWFRRLERKRFLVSYRVRRHGSWGTWNQLNPGWNFYDRIDLDSRVRVLIGQILINEREIRKHAALEPRRLELLTCGRLINDGPEYF